MTNFLKLICVGLVLTNSAGCATDPYADLRRPESQPTAEGEAPLPPPKAELSMLYVPVMILGAFAAMAVGAALRR